MTIDLTNTNTGAVLEALSEARRRLGPALGMVLTLIIVTDESAQYDAVRAASQAGREHPSRVLAVITRRPKAEPRLDAEIRVGETGPGETILLRMYGPVGQHADSVVAPLLVPDAPVVTWWPDESPGAPALDPLGAFAQRRVTDAAASDEPRKVLANLARVYRPGDTDLSWTRATPWRSLIAATLDQPYPPLSSGEVSAEAANPSADLIVAWLSVKLGIPVRRSSSGGPGITAVRFTTAEGEIALSRPDGRTATLSWTGHPDRNVALHRRDTAELLAEELRRLDPDEVYAESMEWLAGEADHVNGSGAGGDPGRGAAGGDPGRGADGGSPDGADGGSPDAATTLPAPAAPPPPPAPPVSQQVAGA
jgi:glucose-6-phosphate dehydrogenase assembly protein OpcA